MQYWNRVRRKRIRGVVFKGNREAEIRAFPDPHAGPGEAVVKIRASGLCGTDLHRYRAAEPTEMITGYEPCGVIAELGPGALDGLAVGDRIMVHHYRGCGVCEMCAMGYEQLCPQGRVTYGGGTGHGANADYILVPSRTLVHLHDDLSFEAGAAISCGTGTGWNGLKKMDVSGRDMVAVFGQGPVGLSGTLSAKWMGSSVIAIDVVSERLELARELGADHVINSRETDPVAAIRDLTGGAGASAVLVLQLLDHRHGQFPCHARSGGPRLAYAVDADRLSGQIVRKVTMCLPRLTVQSMLRILCQKPCRTIAAGTGMVSSRSPDT
jgi:(R,R)-butanediol dehydrogenase/meso-butanediol dehydrogenase/diacetyl reductase